MRPREKGFTLIEVLIAMALTLVVVAAAVSVYRQSVQTAVMVSRRAEMQSEIRAAANQLVRDLNRRAPVFRSGAFRFPVWLPAAPIPASAAILRIAT